jgi:hypothetical protein
MLVGPKSGSVGSHVVAVLPVKLTCKCGSDVLLAWGKGCTRSAYLVLLIALCQCKLDMERHCKWIVHGADGLQGKGCTRMRPKLHLPVLA